MKKTWILLVFLALATLALANKFIGEMPSVLRFMGLSNTDPDGVTHYRGSPTIAMPLTNYWLFRLEKGGCVTTPFRWQKAGSVTTYIKLDGGKGGYQPHCSGLTNEQLDFRDSSPNRVGEWECDPPPPDGTSCFDYYPSKGKRIRFHEGADCGVIACRKE